MDDELKTLRARDRDFQEAASLVGPDEHFEISEVESSHGVSVSVEYGWVGDPMSSGVPEDHRIHRAKLLRSVAPRQHLDSYRVEPTPAGQQPTRASTRRNWRPHQMVLVICKNPHPARRRVRRRARRSSVPGVVDGDASSMSGGGSSPRRTAAILAVWAGVLPQQLPITATPAARAR